MARIRSSKRGNTAAVAAAARDIDFGHFWRQLRAAGWTYKRPRGLETDGRYVSPDETEVFIGERALVAHALASGILEDSADQAASSAAAQTTTTSAAARTSTAAARTSAAAARISTMAARTSTAAARTSTAASGTSGAASTTAAAAARTSTAAGRASAAVTTKTKSVAQSTTASSMTSAGEALTSAVTTVRTTAARARSTSAAAGTAADTGDPGLVTGASQIDTTVGLSQGTLDHLFGSSSDSEAELSQAAVPHAFDLSPSDIPIEASQREAAVNLQLLSEASGLESGGDHDEEEEKRPEPPRRTLRPRAWKRDVNFIPDNENENDYVSFDSGDDEGEAVVDEEEDPQREDPEEDEVVLSEDDAEQLDEAYISSLMIGNDELSKRAKKQREAALRATAWTNLSSDFEVNAMAYRGLIQQMAQPVAELRDLASSPLSTFFYFMPKSMWVQINDQTNRYNLQQIDQRAQVLHGKQSGRRTETLKQIKRRLKLKRGYETHEILHVVGLLVARMLCPHKRRFADHWSMVEDGAIPAGNFGRFMGRNRCQDILRDLHFVDNEAERTRDKMWKLRPIVDRLQQRFLDGWSLPAVFSFDEGVLPATSRRNTTRMFMPDKPHRYGSKMFMTCDSRTAYCHRFEIYAGKCDGDAGDDDSFDHKTGAAAVVRNLKAVFEAKERYQWHTVVIDRYYSSILLAIELLSMNVYVIGTIMPNRLGYDVRIKEKRQSRPASIPRGTFTFSRSIAVPTMIAFHWWDRKPVHYLCTGSVMTQSSVGRNIKRIGPITVPCPAAVSDYQRWMGGVDVHDQLRLQRFSLQTSTKFKKYYKSLFLGLVDMAMVNAYLTHKEAARIAGSPSMTRGEWFGVLQNQLLQLKAQDFVGVVVTPTIANQKRKRSRTRHTHAPEQNEDWVTVSGVQKRRQRSCKVCALLRTSESKKSFATTWFCERCSVDDAKCWLCNKIRREYKGVSKTCFEIWHDDFDAGEAIPPTLGKRVVLRRPGQKAGVRKKTRRELQLCADANDDGSESDNEEGSDDE